MKPTKPNNAQERFVDPRLSNMLSPNHPLIQLSHFINWKSLEKQLSELFVETAGQPAKPVRLVVGIFMLQHMYGLSDEAVVHRWPENPYWQYFCGYDYLQHKPPLHPTSLIRWRYRLGEEGLSTVLGETIATAVLTRAIKKKALKRSSPTQQ